MPLPRRQFLAAPLLAAAQSSAPRRLRREQCYFGLHFDLHPNDQDVALGRDLTEPMVERFLDRVKPDYVQYDCKGHVGYLGYPSTVSTPASNIVQDSLALWRRVTARRGVGLFIHFSGVWDSLAIKQHPDWAAVRADGTRDANATSVYGPYVDQRMLPQLKEAIGKYDLDGAWVDGECWALRLDYSPAAVRAFTESTGLSTLPKSARDPGWAAFLDLQRERFRQYLQHYVDELHRFRPSFQVASNWLYTTYVPERPELPVDFVSGDYLGNASISTARLEARYLSAAGKPWDLMAWGFQHNPNSATVVNHKSAVQLQQEAAIVLAQGGGFQIYYQPTRAGWLDDRLVGVMEKVARFCRERQAVSHQTESVPDIGVVFSKASLYSTAGKLFGGWGAATNPARGMIDALAANHYTVDVIPDWKLAEAASRYGLIILPDWPDTGAATRDALVEYVKRGGRLLVAGASNAVLFGEMLPVERRGSPTTQTSFVPADEVFANLSGSWQTVRADAGAKVLLERFPAYDSRRDGLVAATVSRLGQGQIAAFYGPLGTVYATTHAAPTRQIVKQLVEAIHRPLVELEAPPVIEAALRRKGGRTLLHLVNTAGMQVAAEYAVIDYVPPVGPVRVQVRLPRAPRRVTLEPAGAAVKGNWKDGVWTGVVERVEIHSVMLFA